MPGRGLFARAGALRRPAVLAIDAARTVTETAVDALRARGEPARTERLLGEILVGLERAGQLRRLATPRRRSLRSPNHTSRPGTSTGPWRTATPRPDAPRPMPARAPTSPASAPPRPRHRDGRRRLRGHGARPDRGPDQVDRLVALIRDELARPTQRRLVEIEPGRWWLGDREDRERPRRRSPTASNGPSTASSPPPARCPRPPSSSGSRRLFTGPDLPDETLVRSCLDSYRSRASTPDRLVTADELRPALRGARRAAAPPSPTAATGSGCRSGSACASSPAGSTAAGSPTGSTTGSWSVHLPGVVRGPVDELEAVDCIWYVRGRAAFLFEVEWTAMLGEPIVRRHGRIPQDDRLVRFLVVPPERDELVRHKLDRSPLLRAALDEGNWHILKWNHLRTFLARRPPDLDDLEPLARTGPAVERSAEQLPLFGRGALPFAPTIPTGARARAPTPASRDQPGGDTRDRAPTARRLPSTISPIASGRRSSSSTRPSPPSTATSATTTGSRTRARPAGRAAVRLLEQTRARGRTRSRPTACPSRTGSPATC